MTPQSRCRGDKRERRCRGCGAILPVTRFPHIKPRARPVRPGSRCYPCAAAQQRVYRARATLTPEGKARLRAQRRRWITTYRERHLERYRALQRAASRRHWQRIKADPERHERFKQDRRIDLRLRRERAGAPLPPVPKVPKGRYIYLNPEPILPFIAMIHDIEGEEATLARGLRRLTSGTSRRVELSVVDAIALRVGLMPQQIYPELEDVG